MENQEIDLNKPFLSDVENKPDMSKYKTIEGKDLADLFNKLDKSKTVKDVENTLSSI